MNATPTHAAGCECSACAQLALAYGANSRLRAALGEPEPAPLAKTRPRPVRRFSLWQRALASRERTQLVRSLECVIAHLAGCSPVGRRQNQAVLAYLRGTLEDLTIGEGRA